MPTRDQLTAQIDRVDKLIETLPNWKIPRN
jgi:hypothetical protein